MKSALAAAPAALGNFIQRVQKCWQEGVKSERDGGQADWARMSSEGESLPVSAWCRGPWQVLGWVVVM